MTALAGRESRAVPATDTRPAGSYERLSKFRTRHGVTVERPVNRQHKDNQAAAELFGLPPVIRYTDENRSASRFATRERERWVALLADLRAGKLSAVTLWVVDRVVRQTADVDDLLDACRTGGAVLIQSGSLSVINPDDPDAVAMLKIGAVFAETEAAKTSKRVRRAMESIRQDGRPHPGRRRFGYTTTMEPHPTEADEVRRMAAALLGGESLYSLAADLTARGITGTSGSNLSGSNLRHVLLRPDLAGLRTHRGQVIGDGAWTPILDRATWEAVRALLEKPERRTAPTTVRRYLLTGIGRCGVCEGPLRADRQTTKARLGPIYSCAAASHVSRNMAAVDAVVHGYVAQVLSEIDGTGTPLRPEPDDRAPVIRLRIATLAENLAGVAVDKALGRITEAAYLAAAEAVDKETKHLAAELADLAVAQAAPVAALDGLTGHPADQCRALFLALPLGRRRAVITALRLRVTVEKAARRGAPWDPRTVKIERMPA